MFAPSHSLMCSRGGNEVWGWVFRPTGADHSSGVRMDGIDGSAHGIWPDR